MNVTLSFRLPLPYFVVSYWCLVHFTIFFKTSNFIGGAGQIMFQNVQKYKIKVHLIGGIRVTYDDLPISETLLILG